MKKIFFSIVVVMAGIAAAAAQDTVNMRAPLDKYFYFPTWPDSIETIYHRTRLSDGGVSPAGEWGRYCFSPKDVTIYGIAAALYSEKRMWGDNVDITWLYYDTTDQAEYLRLYHPEGDSIRYIAQAPVQLGVTPIAFVANFDTVSPPRYKGLSADMYEVYFDEPQVVRDSFYVGITCFASDAHYKAPDGRTYYQKAPRTIPRALALRLDTLPPEWLYFDNSSREGYESHWVFSAWATHCPCTFALIFPILTPPDTTAETGEEPFAARYVTVSPNPASNKVTVLSSFPFSQIDVYDAMGHAVLSDKSEGQQATVDVSSLPSGMYLFQIHTMMGVATKKLIVEHTK